jgi:hypothetical protein
VKKRVFQSEEQILAAITDSWNELTFEDIQRIFHNWMERPIWAIANNGEYYQSQMVEIAISFTGSRNSLGAQAFFYPRYLGVDVATHVMNWNVQDPGAVERSVFFNEKGDQVDHE